MIYNILAWLLPSKGVDFAVRGLVKASAALSVAEQRQQEKVAQIEAKADRLEAKVNAKLAKLAEAAENELNRLDSIKDAAVDEAERAGRIAKKLANLIA
jgi:hypothetical protein